MPFWFVMEMFLAYKLIFNIHIFNNFKSIMLQEVLIKIILKKLDECWAEINLTPFCGILWDCC